MRVVKKNVSSCQRALQGVACFNRSQPKFLIACGVYVLLTLLDDPLHKAFDISNRKILILFEIVTSRKQSFKGRKSQIVSQDAI